MTGVKRDGAADGHTPRTIPADRYPATRSPRNRRRWLIVLSTLVVVVGVVVAWVGYRAFSDPDVSGEATGYEIINDSTVDIQFTVTRKRPSDPVVCVVRSRSRDGAETGRREILVPPSTQSRVGIRTTIRTSRPPAIGEVFGCSLKVPEYLHSA